MIWTGLLAAMALAFANGANDNFKGVATLYGSGALRYRTAMIVATVATGLGAMVSLLLAQNLVAFFQGRGMLPEAIAGTPPVVLAVAGGAALTVLLATRFGLPVSTTHALTGAIVGVALMTSPGLAPLATAAEKVALPLLAAPMLAVVCSTALYPLARRLRLLVGERTCVCVAEPQPVAISGLTVLRASPPEGPELFVAPAHSAQCAASPWRVRLDGAQRTVHSASGALVCFSRAVNDTPKLAALLLASSVFGPATALAAVALAMLAGGVYSGRHVAETVSRKITHIDPGKGLVANLVTSMLVLGASQVGMPVSTTHVSVGAVFGIGLLNRTANTGLIGGIVLAWITTLPIGASLGAAIYWLAG